MNKGKANKQKSFLYWAFKVLSETRPQMACDNEKRKIKLCRRAKPNTSLERSQPGE